jgi:uncharacterized membrane protein
MEEFLGVLFFFAGIGAIVVVGLIFTRIHRLERDLQALRSSMGPTAGQIPPPAAPPSRPVPVSASSLPKQTAPAPSAPPHAVPPPPPRKPSRTREEWEILLGGKLLNRIGALALILGVGFFLKYAFDNSWITETGRVIIGAVAGGLLLAGGARSHNRGLTIFAQGLVSAGLAILYLSVYASFNFYHLVPQIWAFVLMTAVTAIAFSQAFRYDSLAVALLAWAGGFLTPVVLSTGVANEFGLFTYLALLDAGILVISLRKPAWSALEPLALAATWALYSAWYDADYTTDAFSLTFYFVVVFWGLFHALSAAKAFLGEPRFPRLRHATAAINAAAAFGALSVLCTPADKGTLGLILLALGVVYAASTVVLARRNPDATAWTIHWSLAACVFLMFATSAYWEKYIVANLWTVEALAIAWLGRRWGWKQLLWFSLGLFVVASIKVLATRGAIALVDGNPGMIVFNQRTLSYAILVAGIWTAVPFLQTLSANADGPASRIATGLGATMGFIMLTVEVSQQYAALVLPGLPVSQVKSYTFQEAMTLGLVWTAYGSVLAWIGRRRDDLVLGIAGLLFLFFGLLTSSLRGLTYASIDTFVPVFNERTGAMLLVAAMTIAVIRTYAIPAPAKRLERILVDVLRVLTVFLMFMLVTGETRDFFERDLTLLRAEGGRELIRVERLQRVAVSVAWLLSSFALMGIGIWRRARILRFAAMAVFGITTIKLFVDGVQYWQTLYGVFTLLAMGGIFLAVSYAYTKYKDIILAKDGAVK